MLKLKGLTALELFRSQIAHLPEIVEDEIAPGIVCFSVMKGIGTADTYNTTWSREARGICFRTSDGEVVSRPYHKFFNLNEREETLAHKLKWENVVRVMDKRDGSMIHPVMVNGHVKFKSKKTFESSVALNAQEYMRHNPKYYTFCHKILEMNCTPIFEWTSPKDRIVLGYAEPELKLCHVRKNIHGTYWSMAFLKDIAREFDIPTVDEVTEFNSFEEMLAAAETREGIEGWVIQFKSDDTIGNLAGEMVKVKTVWYMKRHRAMTNYRERDVIEDILDEKLDDVKSALAPMGIDMAPIYALEKRYAQDMKRLIDTVDNLYYEVQNMAARDAAARMKSSPYFGLVMSRYNKKTPRFDDYFRRNLLKQNYGLDSIAQLMGAPADAEDQD